MTKYRSGIDRNDDDYRRSYVETECAEAGLTDEQTSLAVSAAMSTGDDLCDDDFEQMVADVIGGVAADYAELNRVVSLDKWARAYDELNGAPENDDDR